MKSAREIACTRSMGVCGGWTEKNLAIAVHSKECDARTEAIQAARVDGAKWGGENAQNGSGTSCWIDDAVAESIRKVAP